MPRRTALALLLCAAALVAAGCGSKQESHGDDVNPQSFDLILDFFPNADHAGIYDAIQRGYFKDVGLDVRPHTPSDPASPLQQVAGGRADLAISYEPEVLLARDRGLPVVAVGAVVQKPLTSIISLPKADVHTARDLRGKRVGTAGIPYQAAYLKTVLREADADPSSAKNVNVGFNLVPALLGGKVDAILGGFWNYEAIQLQRRMKHPDVIRIEQAGVPTYDELVLVASEQGLRQHAGEIRRFLGGMARGYADMRHDPKGAVDALTKDNPDLDRGLQLASVRATMPVFFPSGGRPVGYLDVAQWRRYAAWMFENGLVARPPRVGDAIDTSLLPGRGSP